MRVPLLRTGSRHGAPHACARSTSADEHRAAFFGRRNLQRTGRLQVPRRLQHPGPVQFLSNASAACWPFSAGEPPRPLRCRPGCFDMPAAIVMPGRRPVSKMAATREYGAQVVTYNCYTEDREAISRRLALERGMTLVPRSTTPMSLPARHRGERAFEEVPDLDYLFVCVGGGGLLAGSLLAAEALAPQCRVVGWSPQRATTASSRSKPGMVQIPTPTTIADGAQTQALGQLTFPSSSVWPTTWSPPPTSSWWNPCAFCRAHEDRGRAHRRALAFAGAQHGNVDIHGSGVRHPHQRRQRRFVAAGTVSLAEKTPTFYSPRGRARRCIGTEASALLLSGSHEQRHRHHPPPRPAQAHADAQEGRQHQQLSPPAGRAVHADGVRGDPRHAAAGRRSKPCWKP